MPCYFFVPVPEVPPVDPLPIEPEDPLLLPPDVLPLDPPVELPDEPLPELMPPLVPLPLPDEADRCTCPLLQPCMNSVREIRPSPLLSTREKFETYG